MYKGYIPKYRIKRIQDLNTYQKSIFNDLKSLEDHDQAKIQDCFKEITFYQIDVFEKKSAQLLEEYEAKLDQYEQNMYLSNIAKIKMITSKNKHLSEDYMNIVDSLTDKLKTKCIMIKQRDSKLT